MDTYLVEYTQSEKSHFERVYAESPQQAADRLVGRTNGAYVVAVWASVPPEEVQD